MTDRHGVRCRRPASGDELDRRDRRQRLASDAVNVGCAPAHLGCNPPEIITDRWRSGDVKLHDIEMPLVIHRIR